MDHSHTRELLALTTHGTHQTKAALPTANDVKKIIQNRKALSTVHKASMATVVCTYLLIASIVVWLIFAFGSRIGGSESGSSKASLHYERTCVDMSRHNVKPTTPAIDGQAGGPMEPFAFGSLIFDIEHEEVTWNISDSLGVEPHALAIHGPLSDFNAATAPVFIMLGVQRDHRLRLAGSATASREKLLELKRHPTLYYIAVRETTSDGKVRELARDTLEKQCVRGMK